MINCAILAALAAVRPALPSIPERVFSVADHPSIAAAMEAAGEAGGGWVVVPRGEYLTGPLPLKSNMGLRLEKGAVIKLLPFGEYPIKAHREPFLGGRGLHDVALAGEGKIDGQGADWWPHYKEEGFMRPELFGLSKSKRILVEGVTLENAPMFNIAFSGVEDVTIRGITVLAPPSHPDDPAVKPSHNTDACDVSGKRILIEDSFISTGDDCYTTSGRTEDVLIRNCRFGSGHGLSMGSYMREYVRNFTVENCVFDGTETAIRIKCDRDRGGLLSGVVYRNITMKNVGIPILVYGAYNAKPPYRKLYEATRETLLGYPPAPLTPTTPRFTGILFENITAEATGKKSRAGLVWGLPESHVKGLRMKNVKITSVRPLLLVNVDDPVLEDVSVADPAGNPIPVDVD